MIINAIFADRSSSIITVRSFEAKNQDEFNTGAKECYDEVAAEWPRFNLEFETDGDDAILKEWVESM